MDAEIRHHVEERADRLVEEGWDPRKARAEAERRFGEVADYRAELTKMSEPQRHGRKTMTEWIGDTVRDLGYAVRQLRRSPSFTATVTLTLALGIGVNVAIFSLVDAVLLRPVPVPDPDRVVAVYEAAGPESPHSETSWTSFVRYREGSRSLEGLAAYTTLDVGLQTGDVSDRVSAALVTEDYFDVLGLIPAVGRLLRPSDHGIDRAERHVVVSHDLWTRVFGADPGVVGRTVEITGTPFEIVGVAPAGFHGTSLSGEPELWLPLGTIADVAGSGLFAAPNLFQFPMAWLSMVGRVRPGASRVAAEEELNAVAAALRGAEGDRSNIPTGVERPVTAVPLTEAASLTDRGPLLRFVGLLVAVVALTLVVACVNVANLLLARAWARMREMGVRQALGAGRGRLMRQLLTEGLVLALVGGLIGVGVAVAALRLLSAFTLPGEIAVARLDLALDGRILAVGLALSVVTALAFSIGPALLASRGEVTLRLRRGDADGGPSGSLSREALVAVQVGLSLVLLVGALLFTRSLQEGLTTELGFRADGLAAVSVGLRAHGYDDEEATAFARRVTEAAEASPAVASAAMSSHLPLAPAVGRLSLAPAEGWGDREPTPVAVNTVTPGYFRTLGIELEAGRVLEWADGPDTQDVVVLNRAAADLLWPGLDPLGRGLTLMRGLDPVRVVGVVEDTKAHSVRDDRVPYAYLAAAQSGGVHFARRAHLVARSSTGGGAGAALDALRGVLREADRTLPVSEARLVDRQLDRVLMPQRFGATLLGLLALVTLGVSAAGIYGVVAYSVGRRTREIGIRMALGAGRSSVVRTVTGRSMGAVGLGVVIGLTLAVPAGRALHEYLFRVEPVDLLAWTTSVAVLATVALVAAAVPATRAVRIDPRRAMDPDQG